MQSLRIRSKICRTIKHINQHKCNDWSKGSQKPNSYNVGLLVRAQQFLIVFIYVRSGCAPTLWFIGNFHWWKFCLRFAIRFDSFNEISNTNQYLDIFLVWTLHLIFGTLRQEWCNHVTHGLRINPLIFPNAFHFCLVLDNDLDARTNGINVSISLSQAEVEISTDSSNIHSVFRSKLGKNYQK